MGVGVICGGATVVGHTRTSRLTVVDPRKAKTFHNYDKIILLVV